MKGTGVYATDEQMDRMRSAASQPYILGAGGVPPISAQQVAHQCALENGLPEIKGYYGCDLKTCEFVTI